MISTTLHPKQKNESLAETKRLTLRFFQLEDENDLHQILGDEETMRFSEPAFHPEQTRRFLTDFCIAKHGAIAAVQKETEKEVEKEAEKGAKRREFSYQIVRKTMKGKGRLKVVTETEFSLSLPMFCIVQSSSKKCNFASKKQWKKKNKH